MTDGKQEENPATGNRTVGVIVPMYNSTATIGETLQSIAAQTYTDLDIVVVDDGSTDDSAAKVREWQARDPRIRLVSQPNAGVAAARNTGADSTTAPYLAFVDADDLWAPDKVHAQMERLDDDAEPALVWCWTVRIDEHGIADMPRQLHSGEGDSLQMLARFFELGNGSSMLMPRRIFDTVGGFDSSLHEKGAQGCEDYEFALKVAERFPFKVVKRYLVGYRWSDSSMSGSTVKMWKSWTMVTNSLLTRQPALEEHVKIHRNVMLVGWFYKSMQVRSYKEAIYFYREVTGRRLLKKSSAITCLARSFVRTSLEKGTLGLLKKGGNQKGDPYLKLVW